MTGQRDIERTLDAWFVDGPTVMPDRLFDAVLDQVERTPQTPLARLRLRLTDMNPRIRWLTAAAAGLATVLVAVTLINRPADGDVGASLSPSPSSAGSAALPDELIGRWVGGPRPMPDADPEAGVTLILDADSATYETARFPGSDLQFLWTAEAVDDDTIRFSTAVATSACPESAGTYGWTLSTSGETLELATEAEDTCSLRGDSMIGTYWRVDCPTAEDDCLGTVDAGTYGSQFFDPFISVGDSWIRRYGALTYSVPDGWHNTEDWPGYYRLAPVNASDGTNIFLASEVVVVSEEDHCAEVPATGVGESAEAIATWLASVTGLDTSTPTRETVGGLDAWAVDVSLDPAWTETCPFSDGAPVRGLFTDRAAEEGFHWTIGPEAKSRFYMVDLGDGRALMVEIAGTTAAEFDAFVADASTVVESMVINR